MFSCLNCQSRVLGCHSKCEKYIKEKEINDKFLKQRLFENQINVALNDFRIKSATRSANKRRARI